MWVASLNQKHGSNAEPEEQMGKTLYANGNKDSAEALGYYVGTTANCTTTKCEVGNTKGHSDKLYFPHANCDDLDLFEDKKTGDVSKDTDEKAYCWGYWLSSPSAEKNDFLMALDFNGNVRTCIKSHNGIFGVRPIICLKSNVKLTKTSAKDEKVVYEINM